MYHFFDAIQNTKGDALIGYYVQVADASGNAVNIYVDANETPIISSSGVANMAKVDSNGNASFYVATGVYTLNIYATDATTLVLPVTDVDMSIDSNVAATVAASATSAANSAAQAQSYLSSLTTMPTNGQTVTAASRTALALLGTSVPATLFESGREGLFVFNSSNLSTMVTADPQQAVYVAPNSDTTGASGAWVRVRESNRLHIDWFGAHGDGTTDDTTAFSALRTLASALGTNAGSGLKGGPPIYLGSKTYKLASSFSWKGCTSAWYGTGNGSSASASGAGSMILMASGCTFYVDRANTENGSTGSAISAYGGDYSSFHNICFSGPGSGVGSAPVVRWRATAASYDCRYISGGSHGLAIDAQSGGGTNHEGNANNWRVIGGSFIGNGGSGIAVGTIASSDVNAGVCVGANFSGNARYGIEEASFLGNRYFGIHCAANTLGHVNQSNVNAVCVFDGYYENDGSPTSALGGKSYATGPGSGNVFPSNAPLLNANGGVFLVNGIHSASANPIKAWSGAQTGSATYIYSTSGQGYLTCYNGSAYEPLQLAGSNVTLSPGGTVVATADANGLGISSGAIGYRTGTGGTVTQATSKSTGVTLNKACGQITMNAAALASAAKVSFAVTNSTVAATDTVIASVASGGTANAYRASVTAVAAGSFTVTVENITAGSLSEAPVINFSVLKAAAA